jgi:hypothetical protein
MTFEQTEKLRRLSHLQKRYIRKIRILTKDENDIYRIKRLKYELKSINRIILKLKSNI